MPGKITLAEMEAFLAVVDSGSMTSAAVALDQPVSSVSRMLNRLEEKLQTTLLRRTTRRLDLTDEGCSFSTDARRILASVEAAEERITHRLCQPWGPLRVDAPISFNLHVLAPIIGEYRTSYPQVELELSSNEGFIDLLERRIDLAIRFGELKDSTLHSRLLGHSRLQIVASPGYLGQRGTPTVADDLKQHDLLGFGEPDSLNYWPLRNKDGTALHVRPDLAASSGEVLRELAVNGQGLTCLAEFSTAADVDNGRLVEVLREKSTGAAQPVHAVFYRNTALSARISSFVSFLEKALRSHPAFTSKPPERSRPGPARQKH